MRLGNFSRLFFWSNLNKWFSRKYGTIGTVFSKWFFSSRKGSLTASYLWFGPWVNFWNSSNSWSCFSRLSLVIDLRYINSNMRRISKFVTLLSRKSLCFWKRFFKTWSASKCCGGMLYPRRRFIEKQGWCPPLALWKSIRLWKNCESLHKAKHFPIQVTWFSNEVFEFASTTNWDECVEPIPWSTRMAVVKYEFVAWQRFWHWIFPRNSV